MTYKGKYKPRHPEKYIGDPTNIIYRSLWERKCMFMFDNNPNIISWASEEIVIPYISPKDNKWHRYFPDFLIKVKKPDGKTQTIVIEVKPKAQTKEPKPNKRKTKKYLSEVVTWGVNQSKWKAAEEFCAERKWEFKIITEDDLGISYK